MIGSNRQSSVVSEEADDVKVGHSRFHHHDVSTLCLIKTSFPESFPVVGGVLLVGFLVGWNDAALLPYNMQWAACNMVIQYLVCLRCAIVCSPADWSKSI